MSQFLPDDIVSEWEKYPKETLVKYIDRLDEKTLERMHLFNKKRNHSERAIEI